MNIYTNLSICALTIAISSCCNRTISKQCFREGGAEFIKDLGALGQKTGSRWTTKDGFSKSGYIKTGSSTENLAIEASEMKLINTSNGNIGAQGSAVLAIAEVKDGSLKKTWDNQSNLVMRLVQFKEPYQIIKHLNADYNKELLDNLRLKGDSARIITTIARAYDSEEIKKQSKTGKIEGSISSGKGNKVSIYLNTDKSTAKYVEDGTVVAYQWSKIIWDKVTGKVKNIELEQ